MQILVLHLIGAARDLSQLKTLQFQVIYIPQNWKEGARVPNVYWLIATSLGKRIFIWTNLFIRKQSGVMILSYLMLVKYNKNVGELTKCYKVDELNQKKMMMMMSCTK